MIEQEVIDKILYGIKIEDALRNDGLSLKKEGVNYKSCCPFHNEKTPSFVVSPAKGIYKCFGCGEGGNVITYFQRLHDMTFIEAVEHLAQENNIEYNKRELSPQEREQAFKQEQLFTINKVALDYYLQEYKSCADAKKYAEGRWLPQTIQDVQIGYAPLKWRGFLDYAKNLGYKEDIILEAGLATKTDKGVFDFFLDRLMFPIRNITGNIIGFAGRVLKDGKDKDKVLKFINTRDTAIFHKKDMLYGMFEARRECRSTSRINLVEGMPDVVRMQERGIVNTVATLGTELTKEQVILIKSNAKTVVIIGDTDPAGFKAVVKSGTQLFKAGLNVSVMRIPDGEGKDPDEYFKKWDNKYEDALNEHTIDYIDYIAAEKLYGVTSTAEKADKIQEICEVVCYCPVESTIEMYIDHLGKNYPPKTAWSQKLYEIRNQRQMENLTDGNDSQKQMWQTFGFTEERNCYHSHGKKANEKWSNFKMTPLAHVKSISNSKRLYIIKNEFGSEQTIELKQDELVSLSKFRIRVESMGNFLWLAGEGELFKLKNYLYHNTESCTEITQLGWQKRHGFYAWGNGGFFDGEFTPVDEIGVLRINDSAFYLPAFSKIFKGEDMLFQFERKFVHVQGSKITLEDYTQKLISVFGDNAKVAMCFLIATLFRDIITSQTMSFPILNIFGPKGSGKTELAQSLTSFFTIKNKAANLNSTTIPALGETVAQVSNAIVHIDEYKNDIEKERREFLKGLWEGSGRSRMNMDRDKKREMTTVDSGIVLSGQEMATADNALFSRLIFLTFYKTVYSDDEQRWFKELKRIEGRGLTHLTNQILLHRQRMEVDYCRSRDLVATDMQRELESYTIEDRTVNNWITPLAAFKCLEDDLRLPFTYDDILAIATRGIIEQDMKTRQNNELSGFWDTVENLVRSAKMWNAVDFHIKYLPKEVRMLQSNSPVTLNPDKQYLQICFNRIVSLYLIEGRNTGQKVIPKDSLKYYLEHSPEFKGTMQAVRFKVIDTQAGYISEKVDPITGGTTSKSVVNMAMVFDYGAIKDNYGIDINIVGSASLVGDEDEDIASPVATASTGKFF